MAISHLSTEEEEVEATRFDVPAEAVGKRLDQFLAEAMGDDVSRNRVQWIIAGGGVTYPEPDVTNCGGITPFMKIAHLAEAFNLPVTSHGAHDVTVHLLAACPNRSFLEAHGFGLDRYIAEPLRIEDGVAVAPERPGHGIEFDWKGLEKIRG